jgi:probable ATP-dependent RNA helicase DDX4
LKAQAETGSGKSAAFLLPLIDRIIKKKATSEYVYKRAAPIVLIIEPTRELVIQLWEQAIKLSNGIYLDKIVIKIKLKALKLK